MKKLYISCPVAERNYDDVVKSFTKMHKVAEAIFGEELKVINTASELKVDGKIGKDDFANRIKTLTEADYFIGIRDCWSYDYHHCNLEFDIAAYLNIPHFSVNMEDVAMDLVAILHGKSAVEAVI